jgi:hypothetical protein
MHDSMRNVFYINEDACELGFRHLSVSWAWSSVNPVTLVRSWRKLLPDLEDDDLQSFPNEISKSKILGMVCAMRNFENFDENKVEE